LFNNAMPFSKAHLLHHPSIQTRCMEEKLIKPCNNINKPTLKEIGLDKLLMMPLCWRLEEVLRPLSHPSIIKLTRDTQQVVFQEAKRTVELLEVKIEKIEEVLFLMLEQASCLMESLE
jgi:hypothetical protein